MTLADLYPPGTKLEDVPPDFHGMPPKEWDQLMMKNQADRYLDTVNAQFPADNLLTDWSHKKGRQWRGRAFHGPRDDYGSKSL